MVKAVPLLVKLLGHPCVVGAAVCCAPAGGGEQCAGSNEGKKGKEGTQQHLHPAKPNCAFCAVNWGRDPDSGSQRAEVACFLASFSR